VSGRCSTPYSARRTAEDEYFFAEQNVVVANIEIKRVIRPEGTGGNG
jgi:hypothetical protein